MTETPAPAPYPAHPRRRRGLRRVLIAILLIIIILPVAAVIAAFLTFDPNAYKAQITAAVKQATGRDVTLAGPLAVKFSWVPTLTAQDVRLANIAGGSAPDMARVAMIETRIALLPMLHHQLDIQDLVLRHPTILLERTADGRPNWLFQPAAPANAASPHPVTVDTGTGPWRVAIDRLEITDGQIAWRNGATGQSAQLALGHLSLAAQGTGSTPPEQAPLTLSANAVWQGLPVTLTGKTGPFQHLTDPTDRSSWPLQMTLAAAGAKVEAEGTATDPRQMRGYALALHATIPALESLTPLLPPDLSKRALPPLHDVNITANLADSDQDRPVVTNLSIQAQNSDLGTVLPGLRLDSLSAIAPAIDQPATINILGQRNGLTFTLSGSTGPLNALLADPKTPLALPVDLLLTAAQSNLHVQGQIAKPLQLQGLTLSLGIQVANLAWLSPLFGVSLPPVTTLNGTAKLSELPPDLGQGIALTALNLTAPEGDLEGEMSLRYAGRPAISAVFRSAQLNLDPILNAADSAPAAAPAAPATAPAVAPVAKPAPRHLIPDLPLPLAALRSFDGDVSLAFASLRIGGADYRALVAKLSLLHGVLVLAPSSVVIPGGQMLAAGQVDAQGPTPHIALAMQAQNLAIAPLLKAFQAPVAASGLVQVFANLTASGASTRALAANVNGALGLASVNGVIDGRALATLIRPAVQAARVIPPELLNAAGEVPMHCLALRLDATNGVAAVNALVLDTAPLLLQGTGSLNFGQETLALALRPDLFLGQTELTVPLTVGGSFVDPRLGKVGSVVINQAPEGGSGLNGLFQSLIGGGHKARPVSPACAPALLRARNGQTGALPTDNTAAGIINKPMNLFQQLLHGQ